MARKAYILIFDRDDQMDYKAFHKRITTLPEVINWWHYIKSAYILISDVSSATKLNDLIRKTIPEGKLILLMEVNLKNRNGLLTEKAWEWIKNQQKKME